MSDDKQNIPKGLKNPLKLDEDGNVFKKMFDHSVIAIIVHDLEMNIINVNNMAVEEFGYSSEEFLKIKVTELHTEDELEHSDEILNEIKSDEEKSNVETKFKRNDGSIFYAQVTPRKFIMDGRPFIHVYIQNITERIEAKQERKRLNDELEKKNKELSEFTYTTTHDLKVPLNSIIGSAKMLKNHFNNGLDDKGKKLIDIIGNSANRMNVFITDLLEYSRVGQNNDITILDISELKELLLSDLSEMIREEKATINFEGESFSLSVYKSEFLRLFENIISNALKYKQEEKQPEININYKELEEEILFAISDNGIGIDKKDHEKIFEVFKRLHSNDDYDGTGIGLSYCKKIVNRHNGEIWLESELGNGSTFYFTISKNLQ